MFIIKSKYIPFSFKHQVIKIQIPLKYSVKIPLSGI